MGEKDWFMQGEVDAGAPGRGGAAPGRWVLALCQAVCSSLSGVSCAGCMAWDVEPTL